MREQIIEILKNTDKALDVNEILSLLGYSDVERFKEVVKTLNELENDYTVYHTNKDKFMHITDA